MSKQTIAVDIDDVLSASAEALVTFSNKQWDIQLTVDQVNEDFAKAWGVTREEAAPMIETFLSSGAHGEYQSLDGALPVLRELKSRFRLIVVTSRRRRLKPVTDAWIERHFENIFDEIVYAGIFDDLNPDNADHVHKQTKAELCRELSVDYLIDDQPKHCLATAELGIDALLFGDYAWNRNLKTEHDKLTIVRSWQEVKEFFDGRN
jgi:uncharacterized HAD superfamily protein